MTSIIIGWCLVGTYPVMCAAPIPGATPGPGSHQKCSHVDAAGQQLQMLYMRFHLYLNYFDTRADGVLMPHSTEPAQYMGQVLSTMGAHSVSCGTLSNITRCRPERVWRTEKRFIHHCHQSYRKWHQYMIPVPHFLGYPRTKTYFKGLSLHW